MRWSGDAGFYAHRAHWRRAGASGFAGRNAASQTVEAGSPEVALKEIQADCNDTAQAIYDEQEKMFELVGDSYKDYKEHKDQIQGWYSLAVNDAEALGEHVRDNSRVRFQAVIDTVDLANENAVEDAIDADYDYSEVSELMSAEYKTCADARSNVYEAIAGARFVAYEINSDARSAFHDDEFTMERLSVNSRWPFRSTISRKTTAALAMALRGPGMRPVCRRISRQPWMSTRCSSTSTSTS